MSKCSLSLQPSSLPVWTENERSLSPFHYHPFAPSIFLLVLYIMYAYFVCLSFMSITFGMDTTGFAMHNYTKSIIMQLNRCAKHCTIIIILYGMDSNSHNGNHTIFSVAVVVACWCSYSRWFSCFLFISFHLVCPWGILVVFGFSSIFFFFQALCGIRWESMCITRRTFQHFSFALIYGKVSESASYRVCCCSDPFITPVSYA